MFLPIINPMYVDLCRGSSSNCDSISTERILSRYTLTFLTSPGQTWTLCRRQKGRIRTTVGEIWMKRNRKLDEYTVYTLHWQFSPRSPTPGMGSPWHKEYPILKATSDEQQLTSVLFNIRSHNTFKTARPALRAVAWQLVTFI